MIAPPDEMGELVDILLFDSPVTSGRARARQESGSRPPADGVR